MEKPKQKESVPSEKQGIRSKLGGNNKLSEIASLCKKAGFIFPSSEIYGGFAATYDYGPLGALTLQNIKNIWIRELVQKFKNVVLLDGAIFSHPRTWEASGHVEKFNDPLVEDKVTHHRHRADDLIKQALGLDTSELSFEEMGKIIRDNNLKSPEGNELSDLKSFNLMVSANIGSTEQTKQMVYLRGETCQNIFVDYENIITSTRLKIPFGVLQIGKAFRNEITTKQFILRTREFEQIEFEFFFDPNDSTDWFIYWQEKFRKLLSEHLCLPSERIRYRELPENERAHYAKRACDIEFQLENGDWLELSPLNDRGDWDLSRHSQYSGKKLEYFDPASERKFTPHVVETSFGVARLFYVLMDYYLKEELVTQTGETRTVLKLPGHIAPYKAALLPLSKKDELIGLCDKLFESLSPYFQITYDETGSIGKRYRRQDEIGTPFCVTVDFESLNDSQVTVRDRDTMTQDRVGMDGIREYLDKKLYP